MTELPPDQSLSPAPNIHLLLTYAPLDPSTHLRAVRSPHAGANVLFTGTTRDDPDTITTTVDGDKAKNGNTRSVTQLSYTAYGPLALKTLSTISQNAMTTHGLHGISIAHRLGPVAVCEESIVVAVSAPHRGAAWRAAEAVLEEVKARAEIWKREEFDDGEDPAVTGRWKANADTDADGKPRPKPTEESRTISSS